VKKTFKQVPGVKMFSFALFIRTTDKLQMHTSQYSVVVNLTTDIFHQI